MSYPKKFPLRSLALAIAAAPALSQQVLAQAESTATSLELEEVVVTATARPVTKLESSVSVSSMNNEDIGKFAPRSTAEIFRHIPGIRSESSGGGGNANITIRGIPLATGGSKFMQLHEDGLPVTEFGDIIFAKFR